MAHYVREKVRICEAGTIVSSRTEEITAPDGSRHNVPVINCNARCNICVKIMKITKGKIIFPARVRNLKNTQMISRKKKWMKKLKIKKRYMKVN